MTNTNMTNATAAARADRDHAAIQSLGITTKDQTGNSETFFAHGTELCDSGKRQARRDRTQFLELPTLEQGTGGFRLRWAAERIRCVNLTLLSGVNTVFSANHTRADLVEQIRAALAAQGQAMEGFASAWREAWQSYYLDTTRKGDRIDGPEALRRMVYHGLVKIPGLRRDDVWSAVSSAWEAEPGDSVAHVHNAITRAAHEHRGSSDTWTPSIWAEDETEELASKALYQRVHVLAAIPEDDRAELGWS